MPLGTSLQPSHLHTLKRSYLDTFPLCFLTCPEGTQFTHPSRTQGKPSVYHLRATRTPSQLPTINKQPPPDNKQPPPCTYPPSHYFFSHSPVRPAQIISRPKQIGPQVGGTNALRLNDCDRISCLFFSGQIIIHAYVEAHYGRVANVCLL